VKKFERNFEDALHQAQNVHPFAVSVPKGLQVTVRQAVPFTLFSYG